MKANGTKDELETKHIRKPPTTLKEFILSKQDIIKSALPINMDAERFARMVLLNVNQNPELAKCSPISVLAAAMQSAQLGLEPGGSLGQAYLIPYKKKAQFQIGYRGMIELCRRSGSIQTINAHEVHENDEFDYAYGLNEMLVHKPLLTGRGKPIAYYAYAKLKDGGTAFVVMSTEDIDSHRLQYSKMPNSPAWKGSFSAMAKKTCIIQLLKYLPVSVELLKQVNSDGAVREELDVSMVDLSDGMEYEDIPNEEQTPGDGPQQGGATTD